MADRQWIENLEIEDAIIRFRNFSGVKGTYNREGDRNFCVILEGDILEQAIRDGWNVKYLKPVEEGDDPVPYIQVKVKYGQYPPQIVMITAGGSRGTLLSEKTVGALDTADIAHADVIIRPYSYTISDPVTKEERSGVSAYCKNLYVTISEDKFEMKYRDAMDYMQNNVGEEIDEDD